MSVRFAIVIGAACAAAATGCGGDEPPPVPLERVRLQVTAPADGTTVRGGTVDVRGRVSPRTAQVSVLGRPALVTEGRFTAVVPIEPGINVIDVAASARRRTPTFRALRVTREVLVTVPDLSGVAEDEVEGLLEPLGLRASVESGGGFFDALRPGVAAVCEQEPSAGAKVRRGRVVRVLVAKSCDG